MPLASLSVNVVELEHSLLALLIEWLAGWFDGGSHAIGANPSVTFPVARLRAQRSRLEQPLSGVGITVTWVALSRLRRCWEHHSGRREQVDVGSTGLQFWVRARQVNTGVAGPEGMNSDRLAMLTADLLFALLANTDATRPLAQKGLHQFRPQNPVAIDETSNATDPATEYTTRLVTARAQLRLVLNSQTQPQP